MTDLIERAKEALEGLRKTRADMQEFDGDRRGHYAAMDSYASDLEDIAPDMAEALIAAGELADLTSDEDMAERPELAAALARFRAIAEGR
jgi:hypothetical protein